MPGNRISKNYEERSKEVDYNDRKNTTFSILTERALLRNPEDNVILCTSMKGRCDAEKLRKSLRQVMKSRSLLSSAVIIDADGMARYQPHVYQDIPVTYKKRENDTQWIQEAESGKRFYFDLTRSPMLKITILEGADRFEMILTVHHLLADGIGLLYLIRDILLAYDGIQLPSENMVHLLTENDIPPEGKLAFVPRFIINRINKQWSKASVRYSEEQYQEMFEKWHQNNSRCIIARSFNQDQLFSLKAACHRERITLNSAFLTAMLTAKQALLDPKRYHVRKIGVPVTTRNRVWRAPLEGLGNYASVCVVTSEITKNRTFWENGRLVHQLFTEKLNDPKEVFMVLDTYCTLDQNLIDAMHMAAFGNSENKAAKHAARMFGLTKGKKSSAASNLGAHHFKPVYRDFEITDVYFIPPGSASTDITVGLATVNNRLAITYTYDSKLYNNQQMQILVDCIGELLSENCKSKNTRGF